MPVTRTLELLPSVFQTETNKKFLNATLDQLLTEPNLTKINGFIGRKFAPTAGSTDSYISEPSALRSKYQLEPGVLVKNDSTGEVEHHSAYPEVLQKLRYYGLTSSDQNSAWESEYYTFNPHIDLDKFINFSQYYWLPNGPDAVDVFAGTIDLNKTFTVINDSRNNAYNFSSYDSAPNPDIILARGGVYQFVVDQPGHQFWIQTSPGTSGVQDVLSNLSSRAVYGVTNNGEDQGTVTFAVPQENDQDFFAYMESDGSVDYATTMRYSDLQGSMLSDLKANYGGIDGQYTESQLTSKYIIFNGNHTDNADWTYNNEVVQDAQRLGIWRIYCQGIDANGDNISDLSQVVDYRIELTFQSTVAVNHKVIVKSGTVYGGTEWYRNDVLQFVQLPALTAILDTLYYQDSQNPSINGVIRLVDASAATIDVEQEIIGKTRYTSPNGVTLTNGLKIRFDSAVTPSTYQNKEFYVEGVGSGITLTLTGGLGDEYLEHDYIVINRSSLEKSQWAQGNRWFHSDVIKLSAMYNKTVPVYDFESQARRPIIEFEPNLQLFNFGSVAKIPVDLYDVDHTHPFNTVEGIKLNSSVNSGFFIDGVELTEGMRIIFSADQDPETRNNIWVVSFVVVDSDNLPQIHLTLADDGVAKEQDTVLIQKGKVYGGSKFWYKTGQWNPGQEKTKVNQAPRFDVFDSDGISFGNQDYYPVVTVNKFFTGTELFSYAVGTGTNDEILGFPLSYKNIGNIGDIVFENDYDQDILGYTIDRKNYEVKVNAGNLKKNTSNGSFTWINNWSKVVSSSRQYQEFNFVYDGDPNNNIFMIDVLPKDETLHPTLFVYLDGKLLDPYQYYIEKYLNYDEKPIDGFRVYINYDLLVAGAKVDIFVDSETVSTVGSYEFPSILELNAQNASIETLSLSDMRNHVAALTRSATMFSGKYPGPSNLRDISITNYRGSICQQSANVPLAMMFLTDDNVNLIDAIANASREYTRFKNKFLENATSEPDIAFISPVDGVDVIIKNINLAKNKTMPWFYSDMVPTGDNKKIINYNVFNSATKNYELTAIAPLDIASNQSVLVYYTPPNSSAAELMVRGRDYDTNKALPAITVTKSFNLEIGGKITIVEYNNTDGCYVPETPSKLGLYPKFIPEIFVDTTYAPVLHTSIIVAEESLSEFTVRPWGAGVEDLAVSVTVDGVRVQYQVSKTPGAYTIALTNSVLTGQVISVYVPKSVIMIRGHDGSCTPAYTVMPESGVFSDITQFDFRDLLLLELEKRIFNNIKVIYDESNFSINDVIPGKFRNTGYSLTEFNAVIAKFFLAWVGNNRLDYLTNSTYQNTSTFTWNFRGQPDKVSGEELPGSWRACYEYFYDTQTPHLTPWEMLGFSIKPEWWETTYGPAPYTGGNMVLWTDLSKGYIAAGTRQGYDQRYARPELVNVIPVDEFGHLLSPEILLKGVLTDFVGNRSWSVGARGPVETAWRKSSEYAFAVQAAMAILKPGKYFGVNVDRNIYTYNSEFDQYINRLTNQRLTQKDLVVNGENHRSAGYINWIADNLRQLGVDPETVLGKYLSSYEIKLMYRMAGFSDKKYLKILAEQYSPQSTNNSVLIPDSDYDLVLTKTTPVGKITYSAVIIEKTPAGYRVSGYDTNNPVFTMIPPDPAGTGTSMTVLGETVSIFKEYRKIKVAVPYGFEFTNVQQVSNFLIGYGLGLSAQGFKFDEYDQTLEQIKNWTLSVKEFLFWAQQGWKESSAIILSPVGSSIASSVGSYEVDKVNNTVSGGRVLNQNFQPIGYQSLTFSRLGNRFSCSAINQDMIGLIDLNLVQYEHTIILNNTTMFNDVIYKPENGTRQYRLKLVGSKTQDWDGTLSAPGFLYYDGSADEWQPLRDYLKGDVVQFKGFTYAASKDLPGLANFNFTDWIKVETNKLPKLLPNFSQSSIVSEKFYDVDSVNLEDQYDLFGKGLIGYRNRNYLYSLGLDDISQVKFYQGFIKEKGTLKAFQSLGNLSIGNNTSTAELSEEWAFRIGEYGALEINQTVDLEINEKNVLSNPFSIQLTHEESDADIVARTPYLSSSTDAPVSIFLNRTHVTSTPRLNDIQTAGFPELTDVDYTLFNLSDFTTLKSEIDNIGIGTKIWCANDFTNKWNVYRVVETNVKVTNVANSLDNLIEFKTSANHGLSVGDIVFVKNAKQFSSIYIVANITSLKTFVVEYSGNLIGFSNLSNLQGTLFTLKSMVFDYAFQVAEYTPPNGWKETDVAWVRYDNKGKWGTYKKITPWNYVRELPRGRVADKPLYGTSVNISVDGQVVLVGNPSASFDVLTGKYRGEVVAYTKSYSDRFRELTTVSSIARNTVGLGQILEQGNDWSVIGAPESLNSVGYAFIALRTFGSLDIHQVLVAPEVVVSATAIQAGKRYQIATTGTTNFALIGAVNNLVGTQFTATSSGTGTGTVYQLDALYGTSVSISQDDMWAVVGAPGVGKAYLYGLNKSTPERSFSITGNNTDTSFILNFIPESIDSLTIRTDERLYIPYIDYTVNGATVTFTVAPSLGELISVSQSPGFRLIGTVSGSAADKFGYSVAIATDGAQIVVSAPYERVVTNTVVASTDLVVGKRYKIAALGNTNFVTAGASANTVGTEFTATNTASGTGTVYEALLNAGAIYVYDRSVEAFVATGSKVFVPRRPVKLVSRVTINDVIQTYGDDYVFTTVGLSTHVNFTVAPPVGSRVAIETNEINLIERIVSDDPADGDLMGFNINLCPTNCSLYAGVPMRTVGEKVNAGAVIRYFNTGRQSGYNIGEFLDPVSVKLFENTVVGSTTIRAHGTLEQHPKLAVGLRIKSNLEGLPQFATITDLVQTTPVYFTITISDPVTDVVLVDTDVVFEREPKVRVGDTIRINDFEIEFSNSSLDDVVNTINSSRIPGVFAQNVGGYLELTSNVLITRKRLRIMAGKSGSTAIQDLGLRVYPQIQFITNPYNNDDKYFGKKVRITRALPDYGFLIGSDTASTYSTTTFDGNTTTMDRTSTVLQDRQRGSGAVYMFTFMGDDRSTADFPAGKLAFAQQFVPSVAIPAGLRFGTDFDIQDNLIMIGAPEVDIYNNTVKGTARVYQFVNPKDQLGWVLSSFEDKRVDIDSINKLFLWNKQTNVIAETLDYIDPAKGKILGLAEQEITYKTAYDPAMYNRGDKSVSLINESNHWSNKQVGQVWWDLSKVRYIDYEHGSIPFRASNWGVLFPGSEILVCEWVESLYLPSQYVANGGDGVPLHPDDSAYVVISVVDTISNREINKYYYWVTNKTSIEAEVFGRSIPISRVKELIENPRGQDIKYAAAIKDNAVALFNCSGDVKGNVMALHIDYDTVLNSSIVHSEWELVKENVENGFSTIPEKVFNKVLDSLSGLDDHGNVVPDPLLPVQSRYGIEIRPRQGLFIDQREAVRTLVKYLNTWFATVPLALKFNIESLSNYEPIPPINSGIWAAKVPNIETLSYLDTFTMKPGHTVLVENDSTVDNLWTIYTLQEDLTWFLSRVQSYDDSPYWDYADWYAEGYDATVMPKYVVNTMADLNPLKFTAGDVVKVLNDGNGNFKLLEMQVNEAKIIGLQNGTIIFHESLYNLEDYGMGWNNGGFGVARYDQNPSIELRKMLITLFDVVFTEEYKAQYGKVVQSIINYILTEQKSVDWMFKTNFVSVLHKLRKLNQPPVYSRDNQETYLEYLEEVKPYAATIREYVVNYEGVDNINGYVADFDVPSYYDAILGLHRGPSGEYYQDRNAIENPKYYDWKYNYPYSITTGNASVVLTRFGKGYTSKPTVTITGSGTGDNAVADAVFDNVTGQLLAVNVTSAGINYTGMGVNNVALPTTVTITGGGLPEDFVMFAQDLNVLVGDVVKTDQLQYFKVTVAGTLKYYPVILANGDKWITQNVGDVVRSGTAYLEFLGEEAVAHVEFDSYPATDSNGNVITDEFGKVVYGQYHPVRKILPILTFDRVTYGTQQVNIWAPATQYYTGDVIYYKGSSYRATRDFVSQAVFDTSNLEPYYLTANDRIGAFYKPVAGAAGKDPALLQTGINYPGVYVTGPLFSDDPGFDNNVFDLDPFDDFELDADGTAILNSSLMDSLISSRFTDDFFTALTDTRPEGIIVDGGSYVDTYSAHAPEELIPGRVHESIDIQVRQFISPPIGGINSTQSPDIQLSSYRVGDYANRRYPYSNNTEFNDKLFVYTDARGRLMADVDYTVDYISKEVILLITLGDNDIIYIYSLNQVGSNKKTDIIYYGDGVENRFSTQTPIGIEIVIFAQINGTTTTDFSLVDSIIDNTQYVQFNSVPADNSYIHLMVFLKEAETTVQQWSEISTQVHRVPPTYGQSVSDYTINLTYPVFSQMPFNAQVIVELNNSRIRPSSCAYYIANGVNDKYELPITDLDVNDAVVNNTLAVNDVVVCVDGIKQQFGVNYLIGDEMIDVGDGVKTNYPIIKPTSVTSVSTAIYIDGAFKERSGYAQIENPVTGEIELVWVDRDYDLVTTAGNQTIVFNAAPAEDSTIRVLIYRANDSAGQYVFFNENSIPANTSKVTVEVTKFAKVLVADDGKSITIRGTEIVGTPDNRDIITIDGFSNHDILGIETRVFVGGQTYTTEIPVGFDQSAFDQGLPSYYPGVDSAKAVENPNDLFLPTGISPTISFDTNGETVLVLAKFDLEKSYTNMNYLWITLDGRRLMPIRDFVVEGNFLYINPKYVITKSSIIIVTSIAESPQIGVISFRQFKGITGQTEYLRIAFNHTAKLLADLAVTDDVILVDSPSKLPVPGIRTAIPGVIFVNGERITYFRNYATETVTPWEPDTFYPVQTLVSYDGAIYDVLGDVNGADFSAISSNLVALSETVVTHGLGQVQRGTRGTGAADHAAGTLVVDGSAQQTIPDAGDRFIVALFADADGEKSTFTTTVPDPLNPTAATVMYLTQQQKDDIEAKIQYMIDNSETPPYITLTEFITKLCTVYVGGTVVSEALYTANLVSTTYNGNTVYKIEVSLVNAPAVNVWVAIEICTGSVWYDLNIVDEFNPITSALAVSTTNQAKFLKEETGFLV